MSQLDASGLRLLKFLIGKLHEVRPGDPTTYIGYKKAHTELGLSQQGETYGMSLRHQGLDSLADWAFSENLPAVTGLIIDTSKSLPGPGFFKLYKRTEFDPDFYDWWKDQVQETKEYDWSPIVGTLASPSSPNLVSTQLTAERQTEIVERIVRDTAIAQQVKRLHDYRCQICSHTIVLPNGLMYAEGHHIKPLGSPHNGPDLIENILCVCPNHHVELDYGAAMIILKNLRRVKGHAINGNFVKYHNDNIFRKR